MELIEIPSCLIVRRNMPLFDASRSWGEAVKRVSDDVRKRHPDIPWSSMAKMRDLLIHAYDRVDLDEVWDTVQNDIPDLIVALERIVPPEEK